MLYDFRKTYLSTLIITILATILSACTVTTPKSNDTKTIYNLNPEIDREVQGKSSKKVSENFNLKQNLLIESSCRRNKRVGSDLELIRGQIEKDLKSAEVANEEIQRELDLFDLRTCDLR